MIETGIRDNRKTYDGQVTVFLTLLFLVILSLILSQYRSAVFYIHKATAERAANLSVESLLAEYNRPLRDYYQILAMDGGFGGERFQSEQLDNRLQAVFESNLSKSFGGEMQGRISEEPVYTMLINGDWDFFLREISLNRKAVLETDGLGKIMDLWESNRRRAETDLSQERGALTEMNETEATPMADAEEMDGAVIDPREFVMEIWNQGILAAACPEDFDVSGKTCEMADVSYPEVGRKIQAIIDFNDDAGIQNLMGTWDEILEPGKGLKGTMQDAAVEMYITEVFANASSAKEGVSEHERVLDYESEYILAGNESDSENLKTVLWKVLAFRSVMNLAYILQSPEKDIQVSETAMLLSSALLIPQFGGVMSFLMKAAWAFAEALSDCRTLLKGGKIPLLKDEGSWYLTWDQMLHLSPDVLDKNPGLTGVDYGGYLQMLLLLMNRDTKYRRMLGLMEKNIRLLPDYEGFRIENCIYGVQAVFDYSPGFGVTYQAQAALSY